MTVNASTLMAQNGSALRSTNARHDGQRWRNPGRERPGVEQQSADVEHGHTVVATSNAAWGGLITLNGHYTESVSSGRASH